MSNLDDLDFGAVAQHFKGPNFRNPTLLAVSPPASRRLLMVGSCLTERLVSANWETDFVLHNFGLLPKLPRPIEAYDAVVCGIAFRNLMRDEALWALPMTDEKAFEAVYREVRRGLESWVRKLCELAAGSSVPTFFLNFMVPTVNPNGRLLPADSFGNIRHFVAALNGDLERACRDVPGAHVVDLDAITATYGKMYFSDEFTAWYSHNSFYYFSNDGAVPSGRMEATPHTVEHYHLQSTALIADAVCAEVRAQVAILGGHDAVKMIVVDLDDTLWRGVIGDRPVGPGDGAAGSLAHLIEGWPLGFVEALMYCKKRGIILAVLSKNDESVIREAFPLVFGGKLGLHDFAVLRINFEDKPKNMAEILASTNLLPGNVLYIDDNPVERSRMAARFPEIRIVGKYFQYLRHLLLNAPQTQVPTLTRESAARTEMIQAQVDRKSRAADMDPQEFLRSLDLSAKFFEISDLAGDTKTDRAIELINKTNQWNSTGERVDRAQLAESKSQGERLFGVAVKDRLVHYGDVCFLRVRDDQITQFVMSCRVAGLRLEQVILEKLLARLAVRELKVRFVATPKNMPFAQFVKGFDEFGDAGFRFTAAHVEALGHVAFE